jgi:lysine biosynthesis protein LysW
MQRCPECEVDLDELQDYELEAGETVNCPQCSVELKVLSAEPLTIAIADTE